MTSQVRNLWCRSQNKMGPSSKYVDSQHIVDLRQPQVAMKHHLRSVKNTCVAQSLYSEFRPLDMVTWLSGEVKYFFLAIWPLIGLWFRQYYWKTKQHAK